MNAEGKMDPVVATAGLVGRAGATQFEIAWDCPHAPDVPDDHNCPDVVWNCSAQYRGTRLMSEPSRYPWEAADDLAKKILTNGTCRCGNRVTFEDGPGCKWERKGKDWNPSCDAPPIRMGKGVKRGDLVGMNRAAKRRAAKNRRRKR